MGLNYKENGEAHVKTTGDLQCRPLSPQATITPSAAAEPQVIRIGQNPKSTWNTEGPRLDNCNLQGLVTFKCCQMSLRGWGNGQRHFTLAGTQTRISLCVPQSAVNKAERLLPISQCFYSLNPCGSSPLFYQSIRSSPGHYRQPRMEVARGEEHPSASVLMDSLERALLPSFPLVGFGLLFQLSFGRGAGCWWDMSWTSSRRVSDPGT